jgi:hypothetical protein
MDKLQALHDFWSSFGIPAYDELTVPDGAELPYITYEAASDDFENTLYLTASIWYRDESWASITAKEKQISEAIGRGGYTKHYDEGAFWLYKRSPWAQRMNDPDDDMIRRIILQYSIEFLD